MSNLYKFSSFNSNSLEATCRIWRAEAADGKAFPSDIEQLLSWVNTHTEHQDGDSTAHGVFTKSSDVAEGIVEVVVTRAKKSSPWVKMLRLRLKPSLDERIYQNDLTAHRESLDIFITSFIGVVKLSTVHKAKTVKIFGRSNDQLSFLKTLAFELEKKFKDSNFEIQGRWLVISLLEA